MKPHKILITGTFESGKTELIKLFIDDPRVFVIPEAARDILSLDPSLQNKPEFQDILFRQQIRNEALAEQYNKGGAFPLTLLLNADGKVLKTWQGKPEMSVAQWTAEIKAVCDANK